MRIGLGCGSGGMVVLVRLILVEFNRYTMKPMCGRFTLRTPANDWCQIFFTDLDLDSLPSGPPRYNIAPTQMIDCVLRWQTGQVPVATKLRWGLVPSWADDLKIGNRMINARCETVHCKPSFRKAFARQRCLIVADGYYEWKRTDDGKQPYLIESCDRGPMLFAGLWEQNDRAAGDRSIVQTCTIITTVANQTTKAVHERMPVILDRQSLDRWIDPGFRDVEVLRTLLVPAGNDRLKVTAVSSHVNSPRNDDFHCIDPRSDTDN